MTKEKQEPRKLEAQNPRPRCPTCAAFPRLTMPFLMPSGAGAFGFTNANSAVNASGTTSRDHRPRLCP